MARNLLTTVDDVISAIEYDLKTDGEIISAGALRGENAIAELARQIDVWSLPNEEPMSLEDAMEDMQAELDSVDPSIWMDSIDQDASLKNEVEEALDRKLAGVNAGPQIAALHRWLSNAGLPPKETKEIEFMRKVKIFHELQHPLPPPIWEGRSEFFVAIIAELQEDGTPWELKERYCTYDTDWKEFQKMLTSATVIYESERQDYTEGYTLKDGPWFYKSFEGGKMQGISNSDDEDWTKLESELDYRTLSIMLHQKQDVGDFGVAIRHHQTTLRSRALKAKYDEIYTDFNGPAAEILDENGYPYFDDDSGDLMFKLDLWNRNYDRELRKQRREAGKMLEDDEEDEEEDRQWREQRRLLRAEKHRKWDAERATRESKQEAVGAVGAEEEAGQGALEGEKKLNVGIEGNEETDGMRMEEVRQEDPGPGDTVQEVTMNC
ncbi:hypothetical protein EV356DRAFT_575581 [Viridothelium virens]|uniref:Uncharacterized protein n=1 Tax=Viridothelium virens TaxID=1048519 RepID=A0A6A6HCD1_VIRVR|nr:hypothetical protein EV356DRAFT_575581 [Viridothelium virens]